MSSIILWNDRTSGHHPKYMRALAETAVLHYKLVWVPSWSAMLFSDKTLRSLSFLPEVASYDLRAMSALARDLRPDLTVLADSTDHLPTIAARGWPGRIAIIDIRSQHCDLVHGRAMRKVWGGFHLALREVAVRRQKATLHVLDQRALSIGSGRLRQSTRPLPELRQTAPAGVQADTLARASSGTRTAVLAGSLDARKGLTVLVDAAARLADDHRDYSLRFLVAGLPVDPYVAELELVRQRVQRERLPFTFELRRLSDPEYFQTLLSADYVILPYVGHRGGSGLLASLEGYTGHIITSDGGWLGELADRIGAHRFREGDSDDLARVLRSLEQIRGGGGSPLPLRLPSSVYVDDYTFGRTVIG